MKFDRLIREYTPDKIKVYRSGKIEDGRIIWSTTDYDLASEYGDDKDMDVETFILDVKNPLPIRKAEAKKSMREFVLEIINYAYENSINIDPVEDLVKKLISMKTDEYMLFELWDTYPEDIIKLLKGLGFDSIKTKENGKVTYGVFDKKQLKKKEFTENNDGFEEFRKCLGKDKVDDLLACLGMGPKYKPTPRKLYKCPKCLKKEAYYKEIHPDTDMNEIVLFCPKCKYESDNK